MSCLVIVLADGLLSDIERPNAIGTRISLKMLRANVKRNTATLSSSRLKRSPKYVLIDICMWKVLSCVFRARYTLSSTLSTLRRTPFKA